MKKLVLAVMMFGFSVGANAACDVKSLKGNYMIQANYTGYTASGSLMMCGDTGVMMFDGKNGVKFQATEVCYGQMYDIPLMAGVYTMDSLCTGGGSVGNVTFKFVFDKSLKNAMITGINASTNLGGNGTLMKQ